MMNFLGLFVFSAPYLPWVLLAFSVLLGGHAAVDILGIFAGHLYYFLEFVYPKMIPSKTRVLKTPRFIERLFSGEQPIDAAHLPRENVDGNNIAEQAAENFDALGEDNNQQW